MSALFYFCSIILSVYNMHVELKVDINNGKATTAIMLIWFGVARLYVVYYHVIIRIRRLTVQAN